MKFFNRFILPLLSGFLLFAAWPMSPLTILVFVAWVPLLIVEEQATSPYRFFFILLLNLFIWNAATTWWIWNASEGGAMGAIIANSMLMTIPWMLFRITKRKLGKQAGQVSLVLYWLTFEYIHHNWDLSWPWLTLGNIFANHPGWVGWYQFTGTSGGSLWVLLANIWLFNMVQARKPGVNSIHSSSYYLKSSLPLVLLVLLPFLYHLFASPGADSGERQKNYLYNIVVVQPNIDPYKEKFSSDVSMQVDKLIRLSESQIDLNTRMVVWPETAIPTQAWEDQIRVNLFYQPIFAFVKRHPNLMLVTGIDSYQNHGNENAGGFSIRHDKASGIYYEAFNTAMALDSSLDIQLYHKSKLVPGVESLPSWLAFMGKMFEDYGGISGTLGKNKEPVVFSTTNNGYKPAPVICYESIYGEYVTEYLRKGANIITIITNDGWWGNTPGYHQHQSYARLRAIETGCWIARSANTGISCFISPEGEVIYPQPWAQEAVIKMKVPPNDNKTFYVRHGDWMSLAAGLLSALMLLALFTSKWWKRKAPGRG